MYAVVNLAEHLVGRNVKDQACHPVLPHENSHTHEHLADSVLDWLEHADEYGEGAVIYKLVPVTAEEITAAMLEV